MKVTQEKLPDSQIGLEIEISAQTTKETYETVVQNLARSIQIPGFRRGKIPRQVLIQRLGSQRVKAAALEEIIQKQVQVAIEQEKIEAIGNYKLRSDFDELIKQYSPGEAITLCVSVDVPPTVTLGDYKNLRVKAQETPYNPESVEKWLQEQREKFVTLVPIEDRAAQMGDVAIMDYQARAATDTDEPGEPIAGIRGTDFQVELSEGRLIPGMVEAIVGMTLGETKEIPLTFPEDYPSEELAGKRAIFTVTLKELKEKELPELDDDFAEQVSENSEEKFETLEKLREYLEKQYRQQAEDETKNTIQGVILEELVNISTVELPQTLVEEEVTNVLKQTAMQLQQMGIDLKNFFTQERLPQMRENARPEAIQRLKQAFVLKEIAKVEALEPDAAAIEERFNKIKEQLKDQDIDLEKLREVVAEELLTEKTLDWLQERATVELVPKTSQESRTEPAETEQTKDADSQS